MEATDKPGGTGAVYCFLFPHLSLFRVFYQVCYCCLVIPACVRRMLFSVVFLSLALCSSLERGGRSRPLGGQGQQLGPATTAQLTVPRVIVGHRRSSGDLVPCRFVGESPTRRRGGVGRAGCRAIQLPKPYHPHSTTSLYSSSLVSFNSAHAWSAPLCRPCVCQLTGVATGPCPPTPQVTMNRAAPRMAATSVPSAPSVHVFSSPSLECAVAGAAEFRSIPAYVVAAGAALRRHTPPAIRQSLRRHGALPLRPASAVLRAAAEPPAAAAASDGPAAADIDPPPSPEAAPSVTSDFDLGPGQVAVRFINTPTGEDVLAVANPGERLLSVGDGVGLAIPRSCVSGLCGSCTCELQDPAWVPEDADADGDGDGGRPGWQTIRACSTEVMLLDGCTEMVVDVVRMRTAGRRERDPFSRFDGLDTGYEAGAAPKVAGIPREVSCAHCGGVGRHTCYACEGTGREEVDASSVGGAAASAQPCAVCMGLKILRCAFCQGKGFRMGR